jgi:hypothetical protein
LLLRALASRYGTEAIIIRVDPKRPLTELARRP